MSETEDRLAALEARLGRLEDERAVARLLAAYGPLADSGDADGVYDIEAVRLAGREGIRGMVRSPAHQEWIRRGCAHLVGPPHVTVDGDEAVAVCHSLMVVHDEGAYVVRRATANHWRLRRARDGESGGGGTGWLVTARTNSVLDGRAGSPALLNLGVRGGTVE